MITILDCVEYRRRLAGLSDTAGIEGGFADLYRDLSSDCVLLLSICFNRRQLDPVTLWTRIDSAIQKGLAECDGEDVGRFLSACLEHVMANINVCATQTDAVRIQQSLLGLPNDGRVYFLQYLSKHRYVAIVLGREKWEQRRADIAAQLKELETNDDESDVVLAPKKERKTKSDKPVEQSVNELFKEESEAAQ